MKKFRQITALLKNPFQHKQERILGVSKGKRRYDLPLANSNSNMFLRLLIALMSVLAMLALCAAFALSAMTERWSAGLSGKISVEIPATDSGGEVLPPAMVQTMTDQAAGVLAVHDAVEDVAVMEEQRIRELLSPWLGADMAMDSIPLPGVISVALKKDAQPDYEDMLILIRDVAPNARIDTHQGWLEDVTRFTGALKFAAMLLTAIIGATILVAVAGGVRSKLSENKDELELLHLMGAQDSYIARQLQRHTLILSLQGGICGVAAGAVLIALISLIGGEMNVNLVPDFKLDHAQMAALALLPLPIALLAMMTARFTVLRVLGKMP